MVRAWDDFGKAGKTLSKINPAALSNYLKLNQKNKGLILKFNDKAPKSTLADFLKDCDDPDFLTFINQAENE